MAAVLAKQSAVAIYEGRQRLLSPHILGWTEVDCPTCLLSVRRESEHGLGEEGSPRNWRCMVVGILRSVELREPVPGRRHQIPSSSSLFKLKSIRGRGRSAPRRRRTAKRTVNALAKQIPRNRDADRGNE